MIERDVEQHLRRAVEAAGGKCFKFISPGNAGVPDRLIVMPRGVIAFCELKAPGEHERPLQVRCASLLRGLGCTVYSTVDSYTKADAVVADMKAKGDRGGKV